jgi:hypothetical protein
MEKIQDEEAMLLAFALQQVLKEQKKQIAKENNASMVRNAVHSLYPICGGVACFSKKERFAYSKTELYSQK